MTRIDTSNASEQPCPCGGGAYLACCGRFHRAKVAPETAEQLMRSRYSAFALRLADYLFETTHPETRTRTLREDLAESFRSLEWTTLQIIDTQSGSVDDRMGQVEFIAEYNQLGRPGQLHERSRFKRHRGKWMYLDASGGDAER